MNYRIGIIDDDGAKITQLLTFVALGWEDEEGNILIEKCTLLKCRFSECIFVNCHIADLKT